MKHKQYTVYVQDIIQSLEKIERYIEGHTFDSFVKNDMVIDAVLRNLEIIGEASRNIPDEVKEQYARIPWKRMIGLRNIVIHEYFGVDLGIIWEIVTSNLPEIKPLIGALRDDIGQSPM